MTRKPSNKRLQVALILSNIFILSACGGGGSGEANNQNIVETPTSRRINSNWGDLGWRAAASLIQPDGKLIISGASANTCALARFNTDNTLDATFSNTGKITINSEGLNSSITSLYPQSNSGMLALCNAPGSSRLVNYLDSGAIDVNFNTGGSRTFSQITNYSQYTKISKDVGGNILLYGNILFNSGITRLSPSGALDDFYGIHGVSTVVNPFPNGLTKFSIAMTPQNSILMGSLETYDFSVVKLDSDGQKVINYGNCNDPSICGITTGWSKIDFGGIDNLAQIIPLSDGGAYLIGTKWLTPNFTPLISKLQANGTLDLSFNATGKIELSIQSKSNNFRGIALPSGDLIISDGINVMKIKSTGVLDNSFSNGGNIPTASQSVFPFLDIHVRADGKILLVNGDFSYVRLASTGLLE